MWVERSGEKSSCETGMNLAIKLCASLDFATSHASLVFGFVITFQQIDASLLATV
jgi:hypothetical protein